MSEDPGERLTLEMLIKQAVDVFDKSDPAEFQLPKELAERLGRDADRVRLAVLAEAFPLWLDREFDRP